MSTLNELEQWGADVIFGRARGFGAWVARQVLYGFSFLFRFGVAARLYRYKSGFSKQANLGTVVVSIGNLTVGGTGKTPVVELLSKSLAKRGRKVAILSRGYKSKKLDQKQTWQWKTLFPMDALPKIVSTGNDLLLEAKYAGDEPYMLAKNLDNVAVIVDKDRVKGGSFAIGELGSDTLILDDGLQYLALEHQIDIVLIDQNSPFGTESLLPRGTLREPPRNLKRASYIFITKCKGETNPKLLQRIRRYNPVAEIMECTHGPKILENVFTGEQLPLEALNGKYIAAISGIAVPESFENLLERLGANLLFHRTFDDHHNFVQKEIDRFMERALMRDAQMIVTTEKDAVRFLKPTELDVPIYFLRIEVEIIKGHDVFENCVNHLCRDRYQKPSSLAEERWRSLEHDSD